MNHLADALVAAATILTLVWLVAGADPSGQWLLILALIFLFAAVAIDRRS